MKKTVTWIIVADGGHARILANDGPGKGLHQIKGAHWDGDRQPSREIMADKPGSAFDSAGQGRHGVAPSADPREQVETAFLHQLVGYLSAHEASDAFDRLVLVAEPHALGILRKQLPGSLQQRIYGELDRDLTKVPVDKIGDHLRSIMMV